MSRPGNTPRSSTSATIWARVNPVTSRGRVPSPTVTVADTLDPATAEALRTAAAHAFDAGVGITAVIGAVLVGIAAVIAATTLKGSRTAHVEH